MGRACFCTFRKRLLHLSFSGFEKTQSVQKQARPNTTHVVGMIIWDTIHTQNIWDERAIYTNYNGSGAYGDTSMQYSPHFWDYFN